jgi:CubicO group peptidase (beta-lactamase class C family)
MHNPSIILISAALVFSLWGCSSLDTAPDPQTGTAPAIQEVNEDAVLEIGAVDPQVDTQLQTLVAEGGVPSLSVGIVVDDQLVWSKSYQGMAGVDTVYIIGSVTKPFIATAALQLYERGQLDLDTDINMYLPYSIRHPEYPDTPITVRMLLTHKAGLVMESEDFSRFQNPDDTIYQFVKTSLGLDLPELNLDPHPSRETYFEAQLVPGGAYYSDEIWAQEPGTYLYSNLGYSLLAYVIECASGQTIESYLREHIFEPLDMAHSGAELAGLEAYHAAPHLRIQGNYVFIPYRDIPALRFCNPTQLGCLAKNLTKPGGYFPVPEGFDQQLTNGYLRFPLYENLVGGGGLRTTVPDLAKFMIAHMNEGRAPNGYQLLQPETVAMMHQITSPVGGSINLIPMEGYGMGWTLAADGLQGHIGGGFGYEAEMLYQVTRSGTIGILFLRNWSWELADDYDNGLEYWQKYHVGVRDILMAEAVRMLGERIQ